MNIKDRMYKQIENHGQNLNAIFNTDDEPIKLCKRLLRLENQAHRLSTNYCNGDINMDTWDSKCDQILDKLHKILGKEKCVETGLFVNGDCRGYALKLSSDWLEGYKSKGGKLYSDWGGFGIVAPEFNGKS